MDNKMKLFVWEGSGVLQDHTSGMIVILAHNLGEALRKMEEKYSYAMQQFPVNKYKVYSIDKPVAFAVYGGG